MPTQIVTEYLLRIFGNPARVRGILYASALTGQVSAVLDVSNAHCVAGNKRSRTTGCGSVSSQAPFAPAR